MVARSVYMYPGKPRRPGTSSLAADTYAQNDKRRCFAQRLGFSVMDRELTTDSRPAEFDLIQTDLKQTN